jgi:Tfp pilus assembly protein FimT
MTKGMTLIEIIFSLGILALILTLSIPLFSEQYQKYCLEKIIISIEQGIEYAKLQTVIHHQTYKITPLDNQTDFSLGMQLLSGAKIVKDWHWLVGQSQITWHGFQSKREVLFSADLYQSACNGYFLIQTPEHKTMKLVVNRMGNTRRVI